jgi:hypothetical protein
MPHAADTIPENSPGTTMDYTALDFLRHHHPAWRLLRSEHAPLLASFLQRVFIGT